MMEKKRVLFLCTHNSARSQMAEGLLRALYGDEYEACSAGTAPGKINNYVVRAMAESGIDISGHRSKNVSEFSGQSFDCIVTVCDNAREACPFLPGGKEYVHEGFPDPSQFVGTDEEIMAGVRTVRDRMKEWVIRTFGTR